jgi:hypothetical protein
MQNVGIMKIQFSGVVKDLELNILVKKFENLNEKWKVITIKIVSFWKLGLRCDARFTIKI